MSVQNLFALRPHWPNFGPLVVTKWLEIVVSDHYLKNCSPNRIQTWCVHLLGECSELIRFWATMAKFLPFSGQKMTHYPKKYSCNPIQTWSVHLLGYFSYLIWFWATLAKFWPSSGRKMAANGGFWLLSEKVFRQGNSNLVSTLVGWGFTANSFLGHVGRILALLWQKNDWKWWFSTTASWTIHSAQLILGVYTLICWVFRNDSIFFPHRPDLVCSGRLITVPEDL